MGNFKNTPHPRVGNLLFSPRIRCIHGGGLILESADPLLKKSSPHEWRMKNEHLKPRFLLEENFSEYISSPILVCERVLDPY